MLGKAFMDVSPYHKEQIEEVEEKERLQKEKERKEAEEANQKEQKVAEEAKISEGELENNNVQDRIDLLDDSPAAQDSDNSESIVNHADHLVKEELPSISAEPVKGDSSQEVEATENTDSLSREELGRLVASRWTGEKTEEQTEASNSGKKNHGEHEEIPKNSYDEEYNGYDSEDSEDRYGDDDDDADVEDWIEDLGVEDIDDSSSSHKYNSDDEPDISEAERIRKEFDDTSAKLSKLQSRSSSLTQKLKQDFGPEKEFYSFCGQCFVGKQNKYVYKICPYKQASHVEGHSTTRLWSWEKFEDSYRIMQCMNGGKGWNGPDRSLKVKLRCGLKDEVTDVDEPGRCEFAALLSTPALCREEKLKELQDKLDMINKQQPTSHDEL